MSHAVDRLNEIRNGMALALGGPQEVILCANRGIAEKATATRWRLAVPEFIDAVEETLNRLSEARGDLSLDKVLSSRGASRGILTTQPPTGQDPIGSRILIRNTLFSPAPEEWVGDGDPAAQNDD